MADKGSVTELDLFAAAPMIASEGEPEQSWIDYNGHMNVGYYGIAFDKAVDVIYEQIGIGETFVATRGMGSFALQVHQHYLQEIRMGERFRIEMLFLDSDHKRWHTQTWMTKIETGEIAATYECLSMNVDHATRRSAALPDDVVERLAKIVEAQRSVPRPPQTGAPLGIRRR